MTPPARDARQAATQIVAKLRDQGHTAYLAGGCVRDALLGHTPKDYDVATDATPDQVQALFTQSAAVGAAFGVVIVYRSATERRPRWVTEVATFRAEGAYSDGRRPDEVRFTTAEEDAKRRDFTINGLFAEPDPDRPDRPEADRVIDFVDGRADLVARRIRAIGDAGDRFGEDYLRMLRAVRFAARLGFEIETKTQAAIRAHARYLGRISRERIGQELLAMLTGPAPAQALRLLQRLKLDAPTLNEDPADPALNASTKLPEHASAPARLAAWLIDRHGRDADHERLIQRWRGALSLSNDHRDDLKKLLNALPTLEAWTTLPRAAQKRTAIQPHWDQALALFGAIGGDAQRLADDAHALASDGIGLAPTPLVTGDDLIDLGHRPGPGFKTLLDEVYDQQLEGQLATRDDALAYLAETQPPRRG
ncbi:MAG: CCA tRNA nucleotidyltransferase [Phycisphaeraceae bacterium]